jgi:hypothetical protein
MESIYEILSAANRKNPTAPTTIVSLEHKGIVQREHLPFSI